MKLLPRVPAHLNCDSDDVTATDLLTRIEKNRRPKAERPRRRLDPCPEVVQTDLGPVNGMALPRL